jgi:signal transduction histidine kinase
LAAGSSTDADLVRTRQRIVAAFAATLAGLIGLTGLSAKYLLGLADSSSVVAERIAPAIHQLSEVRGELLHARSWTRDSLTADPGQRARLRIEIESTFQRIDTLLAEHESLNVDVAGESGRLRAMRNEARERCMEALLLIDKEGVPSAQSYLDRTRAEGERSDKTLREDIFAHSEQARSIASNVRAALHRFVYQSVLLSILGILGAMFLLRIAVQSLRLLVASMEARRRTVEERNTELDAFAARVAHDLRGPLTAMRITLGNALKRAEQQTVPALQRTNASIDALDQMITEILAFARSGGTPKAGAECDAARIIRSVVADLQPQAEAKQIALAAHGSSSEAAAIEEAPLRMIALNVVENALKYMRDQGERRIDVSVVRSESRVILEVRDTGVGISSEAMPRLFEPFFRGTSSGSGYGLGLATVKRLVEAHQGRVEVQSTLGAGTTVCVSLPAVHTPSVSTAHAA